MASIVTKRLKLPIPAPGRAPSVEEIKLTRDIIDATAHSDWGFDVAASGGLTYKCLGGTVGLTTGWEVAPGVEFTVPPNATRYVERMRTAANLAAYTVRMVSALSTDTANWIPVCMIVAGDATFEVTDMRPTGGTLAGAQGPPGPAGTVTSNAGMAVGPDPGGTETLRVGGPVRAAGKITQAIPLGVVADGGSVYDISVQMDVNTAIKFANVEIGGQILGRAYLQWQRDTSQGREFSVYTCDGSGNSHRALLLDPAGNVVVNALTASSNTSGVVAANLVNLSAAGYGLRVAGGSAGTYVASFCDYTGTEVVRVTTVGLVVGASAPYRSSTLLTVGGEVTGEYGFGAITQARVNATSGIAYGTWTDLTLIPTNGSSAIGLATNATIQATAGHHVPFAKGHNVELSKSGTGTLGTAYGVYIAPVTAADTNYAIYTNAGKVHFGDAVAASGGITAPEFNGFSTPSVSSGNGGAWQSLVAIKADGVTEVGKFIDFHEISNDSGDFSTRITCSSGNLEMTGALYVGGTDIGFTNKAILSTYWGGASGVATTIHARNPDGRAYEFGVLTATQAKWAIRTDSSGNVITEGSFVGSGSGLTGNAADLSVEGASRVHSRGNITAADFGTTRGLAGLHLYQWYSQPSPVQYGNLIHTVGIGGAQLLLGWSGTDGAHADNYIRSKRDNDTGAWSPWAKILTDANFITGVTSRTFYFESALATGDKQPMWRAPAAGNIVLVGHVRNNTTAPSAPATLKLRKTTSAGVQSDIATITVGTGDGNRAFITDTSTPIALVAGDMVDCYCTATGTGVADLSVQFDFRAGGQ